MNAVMKYPGAKWSIASWIISKFPQHHSYLEPFFGSGAVLFTKPRSNIETVNDLDGDVINLFRWIREDPERLASEIRWTPYAREVFEQAFAGMKAEKDPFRRAVNYYTYMMMGYGFRNTGNKTGWKIDVQGREKSYATNMWCDAPNKILQAAERLRGVQIENRPAVKLIERFNFPNVLVYADPPYLMETRYGEQYRVEMTKQDHLDLLECLLRHKGPVLLSGYYSDLYGETLKDWYMETTICRNQRADAAKECLWMNFEPPAQLRLFETDESEWKDRPEGRERDREGRERSRR